MLRFPCIAMLWCLAMFHFGQCKLILVHTIFRHGERTSDTKFMYPTDPYKNKTFFPYGNGQLTNLGKQTMYNLGSALRSRYDDFLGDTFLPGTVDAWASSMTRTQNALQLVSAGLFPPKDLLLWDDDLKWQPVAYNSLPKESDTLLLSILTQEFIETYQEYCKSAQAKEAMETAEPVLAYIREHSGLQAYTPRDFFFLYITLITEHDNGLELPPWTRGIYPEPLTDMIHLEFDLEMSNAELRRMLLGRLMQKILADTEDAIAGRSERKIHLYSAHDVNIVYVLKFFGQMYKHAPGYSACIALEVHEEDDMHFLEVHYKKEKNATFELLPFRNGETRLYLEDFEFLVAELLAEEPETLFSTVNVTSRISERYLAIYQVVVLYIYFTFVR